MTTPEERRALLRVEVRRAARLIAPLWPIERFIAVNPLQGMVEEGFEQALGEARRWLGVRGAPTRVDLRRALGRDAVRTDDLRAVLAEELPLGSAPPHGPSTVLTAAELALDDLLHGQDSMSTPPPRTVLERVDRQAGTALSAEVAGEVARWCSILLERHHAPVRLGADGLDNYQAWRVLVSHDRRLRRLGGRSSRAVVASLPDRADDAVEWALKRLGVGAADRIDELRGQLASLPGWAGWAKWCDEWAPRAERWPRLSMIELLAISLSYDALVHDRLHARGLVARRTHDDPVRLRHSAGSAPTRAEATLARLGVPHPDSSTLDWAAAVLADLDDGRAGRVVLAAFERTYRTGLVAALEETTRPIPGPAASPPAAQVVFCIDVRSEGMRRHLEAIGPYETLGFAGFFAVPINLRPLGASETIPAAPALLVPEVEVCELPAPGAEHDARSWVERRREALAAGQVVDDLSHGPATMYALAEGAGWVLGPMAFARTFWPGATVRVASSPATRLDVDLAFSLEERVFVAESALRAMGLTDRFAPLVVLCGHGSTTTANPHAAALDCGACGGNPGGPNARATVAMLNDPEVRDELRRRGIDVPRQTRFVAALHDTTTDDVEVLDAGELPAASRPALDRLAADLAAAGRANAARRLSRLPSAWRSKSVVGQVKRRAADWAETRPEWGLARNAAFVVAPRRLTRGVDLDGRVFLHSYDAEADVGGKVLETILTAPMVVAQWINAQYYFSTVDPEVFGAGDKTLHNPVAGVGVLLGGDGDLCIGLPRQSVFGPEGAHHEPVRLLTVIEAPRSRIDAVIERNPVLRQLFDGDWVQLIAHDGPGGSWWMRRPGGEWRPLDEDVETGATAPTASSPTSFDSELEVLM